MTKKQQFILELISRKYAASSVDSYVGCLSVILKELGEYPDLNQVKKFLSKIKNSSTHKQYTATFKHYFRYVLKKKLKIDDIPYPRKSKQIPKFIGETTLFICLVETWA